VEVSLAKCNYPFRPSRDEKIVNLRADLASSMYVAMNQYKRIKQLLMPALQTAVNPRFASALGDFFGRVYSTEVVDDIHDQFKIDWDTFRDILTAKQNDGAFKSRLARPDFFRADLVRENETYHHNLALNHRSFDKGPDGLPVVDLFSLGDVWAGWNWVSLGCSYSAAEGAAAGHCGNSGRRAGDNIFSLRDPQNRVHLTFIVNKGLLGESKAPDNKKALPLYHQAIAALLMSGYVCGFADPEHSYLPENNFSLGDLPEDLWSKVGSFLEERKGQSPLVPANVMPADYLHQFTQEAVDAMSVQEKKNLINVAASLAMDLGYGDEGYKAMKEFRGGVKFNIPSMIPEIAQDIKFREVIDLLEKLHEIHEQEGNYEFKAKEREKEPVVGERMVTDAVLDNLVGHAAVLAVTTENKLRLLEKVRYIGYAVNALIRTAETNLSREIAAIFGPAPAPSPLLVRYIKYLHNFEDDKGYEEEKKYAETASAIVIEDILYRKADDKEWFSAEEVVSHYLWQRAKELGFSFGYDDREDDGVPRKYHLGWRIRDDIRSEINRQWSTLAEELLGKSTHIINKKMIRSRRQRFIEIITGMITPAVAKNFNKAVNRTFEEIRAIPDDEQQENYNTWNWDSKQLMDRADFLKWIVHDGESLKTYYKDIENRLNKIAVEVVKKEGKNLPSLYWQNVHTLRAKVDKRKWLQWPLEW
jgi:hypothetical protein